jgi:hypothetical protein
MGTERLGQFLLRRFRIFNIVVKKSGGDQIGVGFGDRIPSSATSIRWLM